MRTLEREIGRVLRSVAVEFAEGATAKKHIGVPELEKMLGPARFENEVAMRTSVPGVATGLAWTPVGGDILFIEATRTPGGGNLLLTGQLGEVMRESAQAAFSLVKSMAVQLKIEPGLLRRTTSTSTFPPAPRRRTGRAPAWHVHGTHLAVHRAA